MKERLLLHWITLQSGDITKRHAQLKRALISVSQKILTTCLRDMERASLISRTAYDSARPKVEYSLTPLGKELMRIIMALHRWARKHRQQLNAKC